MTLTGMAPQTPPQPQAGYTVWIYDERRHVREGVGCRLVALPFIGRVEVVSDAARLMSKLALRPPDVLIVGTQRAVDQGLTAATQALRAYPGLPVLVLGSPDDADSVKAAVAFGARGYLRWDASAIELALGVSRLGQGIKTAPARQRTEAAPAVLKDNSAPAVTRTTETDPAPELTMREVQVLVGLSKGQSRAEIAEELHLSAHTVGTYALRLFRQLGVNGRGEAVAQGYRFGFLT